MTAKCTSLWCTSLLWKVTVAWMALSSPCVRASVLNDWASDPWSTYQQAVAQAKDHVRTAVGVASATGNQVYAKLPSKDAIHETLGSTTEHVKSQARAALGSQYGQKARKAFTSTVHHGHKLTSSVLNHLPSKEAFRETLAGGVARGKAILPAKDKVYSTLQTTLDSLPTMADVEEGVHLCLQSLFENEDERASDVKLECPFSDTASFNAAFDKLLRAVRSAPNCDALSEAIKQLHGTFSHRSLDTQVPACSSLTNRLDEFNGVATKNIAHICT